MQTFVYKKTKYILTQTSVCNKIKLQKTERVIKMNFFKNNKGAILFYVIILISSLVVINDVKKDELREENRYVMTKLAN